MNQILKTQTKFYLNNKLGKRYSYPKNTHLFSTNARSFQHSTEIPVVIEKGFREEIANEFGVFLKETQNNLQHFRTTSFFKFQFLVSCLLLACILIFLFFYWQSNKRDDALAKQLVNQFNITKLYANANSSGSKQNTSITPLQIRTSDLDLDSSKKNLPEFVSVIGLIEIPSIELTYPILAEMSDDFLKVAPCKFYGPNPNEIGNLCIAGHNYDNYKFFSNISELTNRCYYSHS